MTVAILVLSAAASVLGFAWFVVNQVTVASLQRAAARGELDTTVGSEVRPVGLRSLGVNPHATYRYLPFAIPRGTRGVLEGRTHPGADYLSLVLYDPLLQSTRGGGGPTFVVDPPVDAKGRFRLVLSATDPGEPGWLDISEHPEGILLERHLGPRPAAATRLRLVQPEEAPCP